MLDVFRKNKDDEVKQAEAQKQMLAAIQEKQKKDESSGWKSKLVSFATLGGRIKSRNPGVSNPSMYGIQDGHSLYSFGKNNRLNVVVGPERARELIRPAGVGSYGTLAARDSQVVLARLNEGDSIDALPVTTGLSQGRVRSALSYLIRTKQLVEGVAKD